MGDQNQGSPEIPVQLYHQIDDRGSRCSIEVAGGLIGKKHLWTAAETARQRHPLLLTSRQLRRIMMAAATQPDTLEQLPRPYRSLSIPAKLQRYLNVFLSSKRWDQLKCLEHESDFLTSNSRALVLAQRPQLLSVQVDRSRRGPVQPGEEPEQRGLAASGRAENSKKAARLQTEGDILQHDKITTSRAVGAAERSAEQHGIRHLRMIVRSLTIFGLVATLSGCEQPREEVVTRMAPPAAAAERRSILFLGTSLTAGLGLDPELAYPALIQQKIDSASLDYRVVNAGVSGETSAGALRRIDWLLRGPVSVLVIETGANDGLRGLPPDSLAANIQAIFDRANQLRPKPRFVLLGMRMPPNYGRVYADRFPEVYRELARRNDAALVPFLLEGVGGVPSLNQPDGVHPTAAGQRRMAETVWRVLEPVLREKA
jgi:acyl-CoA thioesterase I